MSPADADTLHRLARSIELAERLAARTRELEAEVADLRHRIENQTTRITALEADNHTLTQGATAVAAAAPAAERTAAADPDPHPLLARLRGELERMIGDIDRRLHAPAEPPAPPPFPPERPDAP